MANTRNTLTRTLTKTQAKDLWINAQRLNVSSPFGDSTDATRSAVEHLGYVQIDTINVIERCHHHILFNRIPGYRREHLTHEQSTSKSVFEYWTHALSYVPTKDFRFYMHRMADYRRDPSRWFYKTTPAEIRRVLKLIETEGPITIRDIDTDVLVEKNHAWATKKPSKKALEIAFYAGQVVVSERIGMLKRYELTKRHFEWPKMSKAATLSERLNYRLDRALRTQALVSLDSIAYLEPSAKSQFAKLIAKRIKMGTLEEVIVKDVVRAGAKPQFWAEPSMLDEAVQPSSLTHLLSPFDPLVIQRKKLAAFFDYEHRFEAYLPKAKRVHGYFALPVLMDNEIVAMLDLKADRQQQKLLMQKWTWVKKFNSKNRKARIEEALDRFEDFQLRPSADADAVASAIAPA